MRLSDAQDRRIGWRVRYEPRGSGPVEYGTVTGTSTSGLVFVRYEGDAGSKATDPADLTLDPPEQQVDLLGALQASLDRARAIRKERGR